MTPEEFADYLTDGFGDYDDELNGWVDAHVDGTEITFTLTMNEPEDLLSQRHASASPLRGWSPDETPTR